MIDFTKKQMYKIFSETPKDYHYKSIYDYPDRVLIGKHMRRRKYKYDVFFVDGYVAIAYGDWFIDWACF